MVFLRDALHDPGNNDNDNDNSKQGSPTSHSGFQWGPLTT